MPSFSSFIPSIQIILRGIGQVMFQNNIYSGFLFLIGIFYNSWLLGLAAIVGTIVSTGTAYILKYSKENIENGLYGFNGALTGIAILFFFEFSLVTSFALVIGAICSTLVMHNLKKIIPPFTAPFVITTWIVVALLLFIFNLKLLSSSAALTERIDIFSASGNGFGQIMFQENVVSGLFFLLAILINSKLSALYALYASLLGLLIGWLLSEPLSTLNAGLMGYNGILCAIALTEKKRNDFQWITIAIILSVLLNIGLARIGIITLTAPFILSTWIVLVLKRFKSRESFHIVS